jgi:uncharacterized damage-inducible protein DinB
MKKLLLFVAVLTLVSFKTADTTLTAEERKFAMDELNRTKENLLNSIKGLSKEQLNFKSTPTSWSIAECTEHLAISEGNLWGALDGALKAPADPAKRAEVKFSDADLLKMITDRTNKIKTPEMFEPKGVTHEDAIKDFTGKRDAHLEYVKTTKDDLRNRYAQFPFATVDAYQVIIFMAGHTTRHTAQIEEVKTDPNYPKK